MTHDEHRGGDKLKLTQVIMATSFSLLLLAGS